MIEKIIHRQTLTKKLKNKEISLDDVTVSQLKSAYSEFKNFKNEQTIRKILQWYFDNDKDKRILQFILSSGEEYFSFEKFKKYCEFRKEKPMVVNREYLSIIFPHDVVEYKINEYKKKHSDHNPYNIDYVSERDGISLDNAKLIITSHKQKVSQTLDGFIKRYGDIVGLEKYNQFKEKSLKSSNYEYWENNIYDKIEDKEKAWNFYKRRRSKRCVEYYIYNLGCSEEEAILKVREYQSKPEMLQKRRATAEKNRNWAPLGDNDEYKIYRNKVRTLTKHCNVETLENYEKRGNSGIESAYHLDHKYSITQGFIDNIAPEIIGSIHNLEFIPWRENAVKQGGCSITKEQLIKLYEDSLNENKID